MNITKVTTSKTYQLHTLLRESGFNVTISSMFQYDYDKDNSYLSITVRGAEDRLNELYEIAKEFEIRVIKYAKANDVCLEVRKPHEFAEFISDPVWREYCPMPDKV